MSNRIREIAQEQGRTLVWLGAKIGKPRNLFNYMLNEDRFTLEQKRALVDALGVTMEKAFPDTERQVA